MIAPLALLTLALECVPGFLVGTAAAAPFQVYDLQSDDGSFLSTGATGQWKWGSVANGPGAGFDGTHAWSTGLARDYLNDTVDYLEIPVPDLTGVARPVMCFQHWYEIVAGDRGWIEVDSGNGFEVVSPLYGYPASTGFVGSSGGWRPVVVDLSVVDTAAPSTLDLRVRFVFEADLANVGDGWTIDNVAFHDGDVAPPRISDLSQLADTEDLAGPYAVEVSVEDDTIVSSVTLAWSGGGVEGSAQMEPTGAGTWRGEIPPHLPDTEVSYWVRASDGLNTSREPADSELTFRVYLPAPTGLTGPSGRVVGATVPLSWSAPMSAHEVVGYEVLRGGLAVLEVTEPHADAPLLGALESYAVRAIFEEGPGDISSVLVVDGVLPTLGAVRPDTAWPGESVRVRISGSYLLLVDGTVSLDLGAGVEIGPIDVRDVDSAFVDLFLAENATPGPRTLTLQSGDNTVTLADAFLVLPGVERPRLTGIEPDAVRQGDQAELEIRLVGGLEALPTVDLGVGIAVDSVEQVEGDTAETQLLRVHYTVRADAPLGVRTVLVDDGARVFDGVTLEVERAFATSARSCGTSIPSGSASPAALLGLVGLAGVMVRRRRS
ncbi:MAG: hypothetical protein Q8P18_28500 [Pseudomonadota bacterium]|nr:hypothetical protein [Pseudomonadota bacterium]